QADSNHSHPHPDAAVLQQAAGGVLQHPQPAAALLQLRSAEHRKVMEEERVCVCQPAGQDELMMMRGP
ncbi:unnamed protein product, partial [Urochloa humidicola]